MTDRITHLGLIDDDDIVLDAAALEIAALDHPDADLDPYGTFLAKLAARLAEAGDDAPDSAAQARVLARVIAGEFGFSGDAVSYDDPANADMIRVLDRRRGLPVSLSILYVALARRQGWAADALNMPGHVVVRIGGAIAPVLIDPFRTGRTIGPDALQAIVTGMSGPGATLAPEHLAPLSNRDILTRLLLNQATRAEAQGGAARARIIYDRITVIAPANVHAWWQRARLQLAARDIAGARASLSALLEMTREPALRGRVVDMLARLAAGD